MNALPVTAFDLALASTLVLLCAGLSLVLALSIHRALLWAAVRMVVQLLLVGLVLRAVFALSSPWLTGLIAAAMIAAAAYEVGSRQERRFAGRWHYVVGGTSVALPTIAITVLALITTLRPEPWYDARHAIPLAGIILGNVMNAASLALNSVFTAVWRERAAIEARLALGDDRYAAFGGIVRQAVRGGLIPSMNQMAAAGIITLPGIMTGQILAGMDPLLAARYQILLMFLLVGGSFLGVAGASLLAAWRLTDERDRLRLDRLEQR
ncbi:ABC transporter permease [Variovorax terrae]|uniref:Iron export ABC transporter permease subunit FetB n=1 Tax=Variovorax terrae TaxID=2923278 RepID=A0A9X1VPW1_9BURK|nr:iron export ABC transporter permease subunit FetB [Variovorax terrae]MCJ0761626.1 iron export ABC transporter permease subunit FetB [Variovorax terrae]